MNLEVELNDGLVRFKIIPTPTVGGFGRDFGFGGLIIQTRKKEERKRMLSILFFFNMEMLSVLIFVYFRGVCFLGPDYKSLRIIMILN